MGHAENVLCFASRDEAAVSRDRAVDFSHRQARIIDGFPAGRIQRGQRVSSKLLLRDSALIELGNSDKVSSKIVELERVLVVEI